MNLRIGVLVPLAAALVIGGCANLGVHPFPKDVEPGHGWKTGLAPFPHGAMNPHPTKTLGLSVFPSAGKDEGRSIGLNPFPLGKEEVAEADGCGGRCGPGCASPCCAGAAAPPAADVAITGPAPAPDPVVPAQPVPAAPTLVLKFVPGTIRHYRMNMDTLMQTPMFGEEGMTMKMGMNMKQVVSEVREDGAGTIVSTIESVAFEMDNPMLGGVLKVDTADEASMKEAESNPILGQMLAGFKQMIGRDMEMTLSPSGELLESAGLDELMAGIGGGMGGGASGSQMTGLPASFPDGPVYEGMTWEFEQAQESPMGTMTTKGTMTVQTLDRAAGIAVIGLDGVVTHQPAEDPDPEDMQAQMMAMIKIKNATTGGELIFDTEGGFLRSSSTTVTMDMENPMLGGDINVEAKVVLSFVE